jgi:hypothetical protein
VKKTNNKILWDNTQSSKALHTSDKQSKGDPLFVGIGKFISLPLSKVQTSEHFMVEVFTDNTSMGKRVIIE